MEANEPNNDIVHPEVRAHVNSLVSALGGLSVEDDGRYHLGDDALEVLRDIKKWIRFYDEKTNRMDVARCLADSNILSNDLLQILALWTENDTHNKFKARLALACLEVMVPLTWPIEKDGEAMTVNHHRHLPVLQLAQVAYKRAVINFDGAQVLHTAIRLALPSMALPIGDRAPRDQGIIKLVLYFLRNISMISTPKGLKYEGDETQISRSAVIDAFSYQDVFLALLTIASNMGEDFRTEDVVIMEIIYHLVKRVEPRKLFLSEKELSAVKASELTALMDKEKAMLRVHSRNEPTRHSRFGTMIWVKRNDGKMSTVTGQEALLNPELRESKMDGSKKFRPPRRTRKDDMEPKDLGPKPSLNSRANEQLRTFVSDFLDSGFNPLFHHLRKSIDREASHVLGYHKAQFFYLVAWFLEAERMRQKYDMSKSAVDADGVGSFNLVAGVLNQEMFITLNRSLDRAYNDKDWQELTTVMRCFTQILLTVQEMTETGNDEDEEIADNTLGRLFYEDTIHDAVANIVRTYKDQGFEYLDACTELVHHYLRILEAYSKQNVDLQVRSRKRTRRKKKANDAETGQEEGPKDNEDESADDTLSAEKEIKERKFEFKRFADRFIPQGVVDTFVKFTRYYNDLDDSQLKRAHRYFYRIAFKQEMSVMLFRVDIIHLFHSMIEGQEPLDRSSASFKEWQELAKQIIRKCVRKIEERPALITELLFSKINSTAYYLEYGFEKQTVTSTPRAAAELEFRGAPDHERQIAIAVGALLDKVQGDHLEWIKKQLADCAVERRAWEAAEKTRPSVEQGDGAENTEQPDEPRDPEPASMFTVRPDTDARRMAMFKNPHLRLLMKLVGIERRDMLLEETPDSVWVVPGHVNAETLENNLDLIKKAEFNPPVFDDGKLAENQLRRKTAPRKRAAFDDDDDVSDMIDDGDALFPAGNLESRKPDYERPRKGIRRRQRRDSDAEEPTDEQLNEKARLRRQKELEKQRKIKSEMYVHPSDDETDDERDREFFENERRRQQAKDATFGLFTSAVDTGKTVWEKLLDGDSDEDQLVSTQATDEAPNTKAKARPQSQKKRKSARDVHESEDDEEAPVTRRQPKKRKSAQTGTRSGADEPMSSQTLASGQDGSDDEMETDDTPSSSQPSPIVDGEDLAPGTGKMAGASTIVLTDNEDEDDEVPAAAPRARARVRAGFIIDSSDEE